MEFFGLTSYGVSDPVKYFVRPDYQEPDEFPDIDELLERAKKRNIPTYEIFRELDCYSGILDGYSYRSAHRLRVARKKGFLRPPGPSDIYSEPISCNMDYGWWRFDPALKNETWYKTDSYHPMQISEKSRFLNKILLKIKNFVF